MDLIVIIIIVIIVIIIIVIITVLICILWSLNAFTNISKNNYITITINYIHNCIIKYKLKQYSICNYILYQNIS